jgi:hypothetical protein
MEFFDEEKLITYSSLLPDFKGRFLLDESLVLEAQNLIYTNMAEHENLRASEVVNSVFSALMINRKKTSFRSALRGAVLEERKKTMEDLAEYASFRLYSGNYQKLREIMELIKEVAPLPPPEKRLISILPENKMSPASEMAIAIDAVLIMLRNEEK